MLSLTIKGKTISEINNKVKEMAEDLFDGQDVPTTITATEIADREVARDAADKNWISYTEVPVEQAEKALVQPTKVNEALSNLAAQPGGKDLAAQGAIGQAAIGIMPAHIEKKQVAIVNNVANQVATPTQPAPVAPPAQGNLDINGLPWDKRIHSAGKSKKVNGSWKTRRSIDPGLLAQVTQELMGQATTVAVNIPPAPAPTIEVAQPAPIVAAPAPVQQPVAAPVEKTYENIEVPNTTKPCHSLETFIPNLPTILTALVSEGKMNKDYLSKLCAHFGVEAIWEIANDRDKCSNLFDFLVKNGLVTKVG